MSKFRIDKVQVTKDTIVYNLYRRAWCFLHYEWIFDSCYKSLEEAEEAITDRVNYPQRLSTSYYAEDGSTILDYW